MTDGTFLASLLALCSALSFVAFDAKAQPARPPQKRQLQIIFKELPVTLPAPVVPGIVSKQMVEAPRRHVDASPCRGETADKNIAFLDYIIESNSDSYTAIKHLDAACSDIDYLGEGTGEFGVNDHFGTGMKILGSATAPLKWTRGNLMSAEAESARKVEEIRKKYPALMRDLDRYRKEPDVWKRLRLAYEYVTSRTSFEHLRIPDSGTDPAKSWGRVMQRQPIGVCVHYAAMIDFVLTYVGGGPTTTEFDVSVNIGNSHAWNNISFTEVATGKKYAFDVDATHFEDFIPLSVSHWDLTLPQTRTKILAACRKAKQCLNRQLEATPGKAIPRNTGGRSGSVR